MAGCSILIVDDEPEIRELLRILLTSAGHTVACAGDGREGVKMLETQSFDVVITDLLMPERDGLEFIVDVRKMCPDTKIIAMSGGGHIARDSYLRIAKGFGAHVLMEKPFEPADVIAAIATARGPGPKP